jgi:hypothetical protein
MEMYTIVVDKTGCPVSFIFIHIGVFKLDALSSQLKRY